MNTRKITVLVLSLMMVLTMAMSAFAEDGAQNTGAASDVKTNSGHTVYLTKEFDVPQGVDVPTEAFTFSATGVTSGETDIVSAADYEKVGLSFANISFANNDRVNNPTDTQLVGLSSVNFDNLTYPRAGLYKWTVKETAGSDSKITYDGSEYTIRVYVKNGTNGTVVDTITVQKGKEKIDAGVTDSDKDTDADNDGDKENDGNDFRFVNSYKPEDVNTNPSDNDDDPEDTKGAFELTKTVKGAYADQTKDFTFDVTVTFPAGTNADDYETGITNGKVTLKHGETFRIKTLPEGTIITVKEEASNLFTPSYKGEDTAADGTVADITATTGEQNKELAVQRNIVVGTKGAYVDYTNEYADDQVTPTGIVINNLPYILLIGLALGGIVLFTRKRRYE